MSEWKTYKLGELINPISETYKFTDKKVVFLNTGDILENKFLHSNYSLPETLPGQAKKKIRFNDLLFSEIRPANKRYAFVNFDPKDYVVSTKLMVLRIKNEKIITHAFLKYLLTNEQNLAYFQAIAENRSGTFPQITFSDISQIEYSLPNIATQTQIATILSSLDDKIELNLQMNQTLEAMAQAIFKEWFVDFNYPESEKLKVESEKLKVESEKLKVKSEKLGEVSSFHSSLISSNGLPKGWRMGPIDENIDFLNGLALQKFPPISEDDFLPVIKIRELRQGITSASDKASTELPEKYIINDGEILFSWSGSLEVMMWCYGKGALNQHLFKVSSNKYPKWFYYYWTKYFLPIYQSIASDKATTMGHIQRKHLTESFINIPDDETMKKANDVLEPILQKILNNSIQIQTLTQTRDALLPKLMSGKIKINE